MVNKTPEETPEEKRPESILKAYRERLKSLKQARDYVAKGDIPKAVERYSMYLNILANYFKTTEDKLSPSLFDAEKEISELLLISHSYWDLAKAYDRSPNLQSESLRCLDQFVKFSTGYKYQHINAQMMKKFIKRKQAHNLKAFQNAYQRIQVDSKGCFIATYSFGTDHPVTNELREFKTKIVKTKIGYAFTEYYYTLSPLLVDKFEQYPKTSNFINTLIIRPLLKFITKVVKII
ncbi:CFI-box-CTERM domain-containing protein [Halobacteriovorax sp. HLS]|uniref:CFI-box-CTERM domain-containing protein n=1 Tax=Halobacteriovorax sp. HLS TaxID=2234000 RepID=UPI000FD791E2|nr:CFI-box-CTERM domain-containing protein [Halobacteriovorax sp. HLS]